MPSALPPLPYLRALKFAAAALAAGAVLWLTAGPSLEVTAGDLEGAAFAATRAAERGWVDELLPADYLPTLVVETPCRLESPPTWGSAAFAAFRAGDDAALARLAGDHPESWLPPLLASELLLSRGERSRALESLRRFTQGRTYEYLAGQALLREDDQRAMIHFWHRYAYLQHETKSRDSKTFWQSFKNPIGRVKVLAACGRSDLAADAPSWAEHPLRAPGCSRTSLTSFDLYNNLLVAYLEVPGFTETEKRRQAELSRRYADAPEENPWQAALERAKVSESGDREGFVWALSNAERLLRDRRANGLGLPTHAELALNLAQLADEAAPLVPQLRRPLRRQIGELVEKAASAGGQHPGVAAGLARLRLLHQVETGMAGAVPLPPDASTELRDAAARIAWTSARRADPAALEALLDSDEAPAELGDEGRSWLAALHRDAAAAIAAGAPAEAPAGQRVQVAERARQALGREPAPAELKELEKGLPFSNRFSLRLGSLGPRSVLALFAALLTGVLFYFVENELRFRQYLYTSFYRREAAAIASADASANAREAEGSARR